MISQRTAPCRLPFAKYARKQDGLPGATDGLRELSEPVNCGYMAHPGRLERPTCGFEVRRSIQLSYGCTTLGVSEGIRTPDRWSHNPELYRLSYAHQNTRGGPSDFCRHQNGTPSRIRTCDPLLRRQMLFPTELWAHVFQFQQLSVFYASFVSEGGDNSCRFFQESRGHHLMLVIPGQDTHTAEPHRLF